MNKLVYSDSKDQRKTQEPNKKNWAPLASGPTKIRLEKNGRGGKIVTVLFNLPFTKEEAQKLKQDLQTRLGTGATFKNDMIEIRGDHRDKIISFFSERSLPIIKAGG